MATIKQNYEKAKADYKFLCRHHDSKPNDLTGGFVDGDHYQDLLENPTKKEAAKHYASLIVHSATAGFEPSNGDNRGDQPDLDCEEVVEVYRYWNCESTIESRWGVNIEEDWEDED